MMMLIMCIMKTCLSFSLILFKYHNHTHQISNVFTQCVQPKRKETECERKIIFDGN